MLRLVRRDPRRTADVLVDPIGAEPPTTARAVPRPRPMAKPDDAPPTPRSIDLALEPLDDASESVHTGELLLEPFEERSSDGADRTPPTALLPWQRQLPPPLPGSAE